LQQPISPLEIFMKRVLCLLLLSAACCAAPAIAASSKLDAPPDGISPATVTIAQILKQHDSATGALARGIADTRIEQWTFNRAGLTGNETLIRSGNDYYAHIASGPLVEEYGQFIGRPWHRDHNGIVTATQAQDETSFTMLMFMNALNDASDPKNDVKVLGQTDTSYVVEVKISGEKHPEWLYYAKDTGLVQQVTRVIDDERMTTAYSDYRSTKGLTQPWHIHFSGSDKLLADDFTRQTLTIGAKVDPAQFTMPVSTMSLAAYNGHVILPGKTVWYTSDIDLADDKYVEVETPNTVVRVDVNGRGLDFGLSSDAPESLIDFDVAQQLGLSSFGQVTHAGDRNPVAYDTIIPQAQIGGLTLHNFAVRAVPFHYHLNGETKIVGLIGFDVLSAGVFKMDFVKETLELIPAKEFDGPGPVPGAFTLPLNLDGGHPFFSGVIDDHTSANIIIDNDFDWSFLFGSFTQHFPESAKDTTNGKAHATTTVPFADSRSFGRDFDVWQGNVPEFDLGPARFMNFRIMASNGAIDFDGHDVDAVVGADVLRYYDVYLDFPHSRVLLKPNSVFFKTFKAVPGT
jgi:hypothetical protein